MTTMAGPRKNVSVHDYPEHLNPFHEDDNHNKIRFWTIGRKLSRTNSISFSGIKDLKNSWSLRSFMRKGKKKEKPITQTHQPSYSNNIKPSNNQVNGEHSPVVFRRAMQYSSMSRSTAPVGVGADRYVYGGSVTPLPRSRFQERLRSSQQEINTSDVTPRMARSDIMGSRLSMESTNPFDDEGPVPPVRASRRKKKRVAPLPPLTTIESTETQSMSNNDSLELRITEVEDKPSPKKDTDEEVDELNLKIELKITEDKDDKADEHITKDQKDTITHIKPEASSEIPVTTESTQEPDNNTKIDNVKEKENQTDVANITEKAIYTDSKDDSFSKESFPKVNIMKYRRNSSVNEDEIRLRRGNLEDFHNLSNKRSKSLTNTFDGIYVEYDINLNESSNIDINSNEEPQKVTCKVYDNVRKQSIDTVSSTEKEFMEIDIATRELEREISKLNSALIEDDIIIDDRPSVSDIRRKFDTTEPTSPNPIPKPRRSHYGDSPINGNVPTQ